MYFSFILVAILGDAAFRTMSGNATPTTSILQAGFSDGQANVVAQLAHDPIGSLTRLVFGMMCLIVSVWVYCVQSSGKGCFCKQQKQYHPRNSVANTHQHKCASYSESVSLLVLIGCGLIGCWLYSLDYYTPVINVTVAYLDTLSSTNNNQQQEVVYSGRRVDANNVNTTRKSNKLGDDTTRHCPNIIFMQHESLSGAIMLNTNEGVEAMPFFQNKMHNDTDFYVFESTRTGSGNTIDAMPALMTGCLPHNLEAVKWVQTPGLSIGYAFSDWFDRGYATGSFSSTAIGPSIEPNHGMYHMLHDLFVGGMETVREPLSLGYKMQNADAVDDRKMLKPFEEWLIGLEKNGTIIDDERGESGKQRTPFYAQMYLTNNQ